MVKDLLLLSQMFYLPSEHGQYGLDLLNEFYWLKRNGTAMLPLGKKNFHSEQMPEALTTNGPVFIGLDHMVHGDYISPFLYRPVK